MLLPITLLLLVYSLPGMLCLICLPILLLSNLPTLDFQVSISPGETSLIPRLGQVPHHVISWHYAPLLIQRTCKAMLRYLLSYGEHLLPPLEQERLVRVHAGAQC